jgi:hypothetical protein
VSADPEELLTHALQPGEKIVWSDREHLSVRFRVGSLLPSSARPAVSSMHDTGCALGFALFLAAMGFGLALWIGPSPWSGLLGRYDVVVRGLGFFCVLALPFALPLGPCLYAVTDRGRGIIVGHGTWAFPLPQPESITTDARGDAEFGDIALGPGPDGEVFSQVSYPLIAIETIRAAAADRAREVRPGSPR